MYFLLFFLIYIFNLRMFLNNYWPGDW